MHFCTFPSKLLKHTRNSTGKSSQEKYDEEAALRYGYISKIDLYCTLCRGTRTFIGCGSHKSPIPDDDSLTSVYYKCHECNNMYSGINIEK